MKRIIITPVIWLIATIPLFAQNDPPGKKSFIYLSTGFTSIAYQDLVFSEMIYEGSGLSTIDFGYQRKGYRSVFHAKVSSIATQVAPELLISSLAFGQREESSFSQITLDISYARQMIEAAELKGYVGLRLQAQYQENEIVFGLGDRTSYVFVNSLSPLLRLHYAFMKVWMLEFEGSMPLATFLARSEYAVVDNEDIQGKDGFGLLYGKGDFVGPDTYRMINLSVQLNNKISRRLSGYVAYDFDYQKIARPDTMHLQTNIIKLGINFQL
ncbi:MAG: hypothetical protein R8G66_30785 [Cytophagales bacterium]|nr:hypothetical protein [Cytophagales bacterium]